MTRQIHIHTIHIHSSNTVKPVHTGMPWGKLLFRFGQVPVWRGFLLSGGTNNLYNWHEGYNSGCVSVGLQMIGGCMQIS